MKINSKTSNSKNEYDLFYAIVQNWKLILLFSLVFSLFGITYVFMTPKTYTSSNAFSISLNKSIQTAYGDYFLKTQNPSHYLSVFESEDFKERVSKRFDQSTLGDFNFKIIKERIDLPPNRDYLIFPSKFELRVSGTKKMKLTAISDTAIAMFLNSTDSKLQKDMYSFFVTSLNEGIEDLKLSIQVKYELLESLKNDEDILDELNTVSVKSVDSLKIKLFDKSQKSNDLLISSMLLNEGKGAKNYLDAILTVEKVELKKLQNELKSNTLLLKKLKDSENKLSAVFDEPFSNSFLNLSLSELQPDDWLSKSIKKVLLFFLAGFFIGTVVVSFRIYYK